MRRISFLSFLSITVCLLLNTSCKDKDPKKDPAADFDKTGMLTNLGNNIIIPNYQVLKTAIHKLDSAVTDFNLSPDLTKLSNTQAIFKDAYRAWQACSVFDFGPAETEYFRNSLNTFPTSVTKIASNITAGTYDLSAIANWDAKGLPGVDYLLFGTGADNNAILAMYISDSEAANRKAYLAALTADMNTKVNNVLNAWLSGGGNYINTFINSTGTDIGSSIGLLVNQLNYDLEVLKNAKLGIPLGKQSMGTQYPDKVEGYYSGISVELAILQLNVAQNIFLGKSTQGDELGFDDYLDHIQAQYNGGSLASAIKNQFAVAIAKVQLIPAPLSNSITNNTAVVDAAYVEVQKLVVLTKTDMASALGVLITYVDNDGD